MTRAATESFSQKVNVLIVQVDEEISVLNKQVKAQAGMQVTVTDNNEIADAGFKADVSVSAGPSPVKAGFSASGSLTAMTGLNSKVGFSAGGKYE